MRPSKDSRRPAQYLWARSDTIRRSARTGTKWSIARHADIWTHPVRTDGRPVHGLETAGRIILGAAARAKATSNKASVEPARTVMSYSIGSSWPRFKRTLVFTVVIFSFAVTTLVGLVMLTSFVHGAPVTLYFNELGEHGVELAAMTMVVATMPFVLLLLDEMLRDL